MPDPNAHPDAMKAPTDYEPRLYQPPTIKDALPPMWWFCPWPVVTALAETVDHLKSTSRGEQAARIAAEKKADEEVAKQIVDNIELRNEKKAAVAALGKHAMNYGPVIGPMGVDVPACIKALLDKTKDALDTMAKHLDEARADRDEFKRMAVEEGKARDYLRDQLADVQAKLDREQLDHAATLGYVNKVEARLKRLRAKAKPAKKGGRK